MRKVILYFFCMLHFPESVCVKTLCSGNQPFLMLQRALIHPWYLRQGIQKCIDNLTRRTSPTSPPPLHWNSHDSHIQTSVPSKSPFVLLIYPEPEGTGSVIPNNATTRATPLRKSSASAVQARLITSEVGRKQSPLWRVAVKGTRSFPCTWPLCAVFFFSFFLLPPHPKGLTNKRSGVGDGGGEAFVMWKPTRTCVETRLSTLLSLCLSGGACGGQCSDA